MLLNYDNQTRLYRYGDQIPIAAQQMDGSDAVIYAVAVKNDLLPSSVARLVVPMKPVAQPDIRLSDDGLSVTVTCATPGAQVWYSWNGIPAPPGGIPYSNTKKAIVDKEKSSLSFGDGGGFGFSVSSSLSGDLHYVTDVRPNGPAAGQLRENDVIDTINGIPASGLSIRDLNSIVTSSDSLYLDVTHGYRFVLDTETIPVTLHRKSKQESFGIRISTIDNEFVVSGVNQTSPSNEVILRAGDYVVAVNGQSTTSQSPEEIASTLIKTPSPMHITVQRGTQFLDVVYTKFPSLHLNLSVDNFDGRTFVSEDYPSSHWPTGQQQPKDHQLAVGDSLLAVNGNKVGGMTMSEVSTAVSEYLFVALTILRNGRELEITQTRSDPKEKFGFSVGQTPTGAYEIATVRDSGLSYSEPTTTTTIQTGEPSTAILNSKLLHTGDVLKSINGRRVTGLLHSDVIKILNAHVRPSLVVERRTYDVRRKGYEGYDVTSTGCHVLETGRVDIPSTEEVGSTPTIAAVALKVGMSQSEPSILPITLSTVETPRIEFQEGIVTIKTETRGATIYYDMAESTLDSSNEVVRGHGDSELGIKLALETAVPCTKHIQAYATKRGCMDSSVAELTLNVQAVPSPEFKYEDGILILSSSVPGSTLIYEWKSAGSVEGAETHNNNQSLSMFNDAIHTYSNYEELEVDFKTPGKKILLAQSKKIGMAPSPIVRWTRIFKQVSAPVVESRNGKFLIRCRNREATIFYRWNLPPEPERYMEGTDVDETNPTVMYSQNDLLKPDPEQDHEVLYAVATVADQLDSDVVKFKMPTFQVAAPQLYTNLGIAKKSPPTSASDEQIFCNTRNLFPDSAGAPQSARVYLCSHTEDSSLVCEVDGELVETGMYYVSLSEPKTQSVAVFATKPGCLDSEIKNFVIKVDQVAKPQFTVEQGVLKLTCATPGATLMYTWTSDSTDGDGNVNSTRWPQIKQILQTIYTNAQQKQQQMWTLDKLPVQSLAQALLERFLTESSTGPMDFLKQSVSIALSFDAMRLSKNSTFLVDGDVNVKNSISSVHVRALSECISEVVADPSAVTSEQMNAFFTPADLGLRFSVSQYIALVTEAGVGSMISSDDESIAVTVAQIMMSVPRSSDGTVSLRQFLTQTCQKAASNPQRGIAAAPGSRSRPFDAELRKALESLFVSATQTSKSTSPETFIPVDELKHRLQLGELATLLSEAGVLHRLDQDGNGVITVAELKAALDVDGDGKVSLEEFLNLALKGLEPKSSSKQTTKRKSTGHKAAVGTPGLRRAIQSLFDAMDRAAGTSATVKPEVYLDRDDLNLPMDEDSITELLKSAGVYERLGSLSVRDLMDRAMSITEEGDKITLLAFLNTCCQSHSYFDDRRIGCDNYTPNIFKPGLCMNCQREHRLEDGKPMEMPAQPREMVKSPAFDIGRLKHCLETYFDAITAVDDPVTVSLERFIDEEQLSNRYNHVDMLRTLRRADVMQRLVINDEKNGELVATKVLDTIESTQDCTLSLADFLTAFAKYLSVMKKEQKSSKLTPDLKESVFNYFLALASETGDKTRVKPAKFMRAESLRLRLEGRNVAALLQGAGVLHYLQQTSAPGLEVALHIMLSTEMSSQDVALGMYLEAIAKYMQSHTPNQDLSTEATEKILNALDSSGQALLALHDLYELVDSSFRPVLVQAEVPTFGQQDYSWLAYNPSKGLQLPGGMENWAGAYIGARALRAGMAPSEICTYLVGG